MAIDASLCDAEYLQRGDCLVINNVLDAGKENKIILGRKTQRATTSFYEIHVDYKFIINKIVTSHYCLRQ